MQEFVDIFARAHDNATVSTDADAPIKAGLRAVFERLLVAYDEAFIASAMRVAMREDSRGAKPAIRK